MIREEPVCDKGEIVQAEFARIQLDEDDVPIEQICVASERENIKLTYTYISLYIHIV